MRNSHGRTLNLARNTEKLAKSEKNTVGPGIWQKTEKRGK
jgi:hypothetical protein